MKTKIFFFDLDGTLLNTEKKITPDTYAALSEWHSAGNIIAINSGRPLISILKVIDELALTPFSPIAIAYNGAQIYSSKENKSIIKKGISLTDVSAISAEAKKLKLHCHTYSDTDILTPCTNEEIAFYTRVVKLPIKELKDFPAGITAPPCKMLCIDLAESGKLDKIADFINHSSLFEDNAGNTKRLIAMRSNPWYLEIIPSDAGKGCAVKELASYLNVNISDTYAAGDEENDLSMITAAGCGIAMCNGNKNIFSSADIVTASDNDHDGLADIIRGQC